MTSNASTDNCLFDMGDVADQPEPMDEQKKAFMFSLGLYETGTLIPETVRQSRRLKRKRDTNDRNEEPEMPTKPTKREVAKAQSPKRTTTVQTQAIKTEKVDQKLAVNEQLTDEERNALILGPNGTALNKTQLDQINWKSPSLATRKLLTLLFDRRTLGTHSYSGEASPAFLDGRPVKPQLDRAITADIICFITTAFQWKKMQKNT
ncbi:protein insensitive-like [Ceratitis capitata]|uniref:protein insensitive-like n=1 Tax=Ceratitis capitata TaxID=7213 RepID=UPI000A11CC36|nr:protein insensitive-like [Ceratitis capitata]